MLDPEQNVAFLLIGSLCSLHSPSQQNPVLLFSFFLHQEQKTVFILCVETIIFTFFNPPYECLEDKENLKKFVIQTNFYGWSCGCNIPHSFGCSCFVLRSVVLMLNLGLFRVLLCDV